MSFSSAAAEEIASKHFIGTDRDSGCSISALRTGSWPGRTMRELSEEQVMRLMQGFTIDHKINTARARELYGFRELLQYSYDYESRRDNNLD